MSLPKPSSDIPPQYHDRWSLAAADGYKCASAGGYQEQNPYDLDSPLFEAWRSGWFEGIYDTPLELLNERSAKVQSTLPSILNAAWRKTIAAFTSRRTGKAQAQETGNE